jgi:hypothetical protein
VSDAVELGDFVARWMQRGRVVPLWVTEAVLRGALAVRLCGSWRVYQPRDGARARRFS